MAVSLSSFFLAVATPSLTRRGAAFPSLSDASLHAQGSSRPQSPALSVAAPTEHQFPSEDTGQGAEDNPFRAPYGGQLGAGGSCRPSPAMLPCCASCVLWGPACVRNPLRCAFNNFTCRCKLLINGRGGPHSFCHSLPLFTLVEQEALVMAGLAGQHLPRRTGSWMQRERQ